MLVIDVGYNNPACLECAKTLALASKEGPGRWWRDRKVRRVDTWDIYNTCPVCGVDFTSEARACYDNTPA